MGKSLFGILFVSTIHLAYGEDFKKQVEEQTQLIEDQSQLVCGSSNNNQIRDSIADRLISKNGTASKLMSQLMILANQAGYELDHAEEIILAPIKEKRKEQARKNLDQAVKRLYANRKIANSEPLRDQVRNAYEEYRSADQPMNPGKEIEDEIQRHKKNGMDTLKFSIKMSDRIRNAMIKAEDCQCKNARGESCQSMEELNTNTSWNNALKANRKSQASDDSNASKGR